MSAPFSFTVRPPTSTVPVRPSPLANGSRNNSRAGPPSRRLFENGHDSSGDEDEDQSSRRRDPKPTTESVSGISNGKVKSKTAKSSAPLVIPALPNRDWRESSRRTPSFRPEAPKREASDLETHERIGDGPVKVGLERFGSRKAAGMEEEEEKVEVKLEQGVESTNGHATTTGTATITVKKEPLSLEEQALAELLAGETKTESAEEIAQRELVIAMQANENRVLSESEALQRDIQSLPSESTMEDFEAVPISAFGIAALRGMGWDPNSTTNVKAREVQRRPQLLGLGATPMEMPMSAGQSRKEREREREKKEKKKSREERTGRGFSAASLLMKTPNGSGTATPIMGSSRGGSVETGTGTESDGSRRRRREDHDGRDSKRRDDRSGEGRYETDEERSRRKEKARERGRYERDGRLDRDRDSRDRDRDRDSERYRERDRDREKERDRRDRDRDRDGRSDRR